MPDLLRERVAAAFDAVYEIEAEIGRGGTGVVYRARDRRLRRHVAIKVLPPDLAFREDVRTRFLREAETAAQLNHPNIVPIFAVEEREGLVGFVMALVEGENLGGRLARERRLSVDDACRILRDVADALAYAHARGIVHRDIKPDNILLDAGTGRPLVTDFGIARAIEGDSRLTITGIAVGTPAYMSPEQAMGEREIDGRSDLYSLAIVGYQALVGELPFKAANTPAMLMKHISERARPVAELRREVPRALSGVIERAMAKKPGERWPDAVTFRDALVASVSGESAAGEPRSTWVASDDDAPDRVSAAWKRPAPPRPESLGTGRGAAPSAPLPEPLSPRSAIEAANLTRRPAGPAPIPSWMPPTWHEARKQWGMSRREYRDMVRNARQGDAPGVPEHDRIRSFRRRTASSAVTVAMLAMVNALTTGMEPPWFLFPAAFMTVGWVRSAAALWADGISLRRVFGKEAREAMGQRESAPATGPSLEELATRLAPADVLRGPWGDTVRRAASDRQAVHDALNRLAPADRELIPDVAPTVDALAERVGSLGQALHRLDEDVTPEQLVELRQRLQQARAQPESPTRDQKVQLLERQEATLQDLLKRRDTLRAQLESASLMLQSMRLDLLALRSAGVQSAMEDVTTATQEARALSREIGHVLDAAAEVRKKP